MKSVQTWRCSLHVWLQHICPCILFHGLISRWLLNTGSSLVAWTTQPPEPKNAEDGIFHNKEDHLWFQIFDVLQGSSRGRDQCLRTCIKQVAAQKVKGKKTTERISTFLSYMCRQVFIMRGENLQLIIAADWLLERSSGRLRLPLALWTHAKLWFNFHPTTGNLACPLIPSQTPTQCLASGNTEVKSATQVSRICHKCWRRHQQFKGESSACLRATSCCQGQELIPKNFCVTSAATFWSALNGPWKKEAHWLMNIIYAWSLMCIYICVHFVP